MGEHTFSMPELARHRSKRGQLRAQAAAGEKLPAQEEEKEGQEAQEGRLAAGTLTRSPSSALLPFFGFLGSPTKIDCRKKLVPLFLPLYWTT